MKKIILLTLFLTELSIADNIKPAEGFWRTSDDPQVGSGFLITTQNNITLISIFTYGDDGKSVWYMASDEIDENGQFESNLFKTSQGSHILSNTPHSAQSIDTGKVLTINFFGQSIGEMSVDGSQAKFISPFYYGVDTWNVHVENEGEITTIAIPDLTGTWVNGTVKHFEEYDFTNYYYGKEKIFLDEPLSNETEIVFKSFYYHIQTGLITCPISINYVDNRERGHTCQWIRYLFNGNGETDESQSAFFSILDMTSNNFNYKLIQNSGDYDDGEYFYEAFKINEEPMAHNGHWRTSDDPQVGSGLYLTTQGVSTIAVLYTYDENGEPTWQIATGVINENNEFNAELLSTYGGSPFYMENPSTALISEERAQLKLGFDGAEIGKISINDSEHKSIQYFNFGVALKTTEQFKLNSDPYNYPSLEGKWLVYFEKSHDNYVIGIYDFLNCSPPSVDRGCFVYYQPNHNETEVDLYVTQYRSPYSLPKGHQYITNYGTVECLTTMNSIRQPYCIILLTNNNNGHPIAFKSKLFFEDIGVNEFTAYTVISSHQLHHVDRDDRKIRFFKLRH